MRIFLALMLFCFSAQAADQAVYLLDTKPVTAGAQQTALSNAVKAMFGGTINLAGAQYFACQRAEKDTCALEESGTCTRAQFAAAAKAGINVQAVSVSNDTVIYRRLWDAVGVTEGAKRDAIVAYMAAIHPDVTLQFLLGVSVLRQANTIQSQATYLTVTDELNLAQLSAEKKLIKIVTE